MKPFHLFTLALLFTAFSSYAQNTFPASGNVGIGTSSPATALDVRGDIKWGVSSSGALVSDANGAIELGPFTSTSATPYIDWHFGKGTSQDYNVRLINSANNQFLIQTNSGGTVFAVTDGNIGIGTTDTKGYKFAVNGNAIATSMTVKLYANWPDYVFKPDYELPALTDVKIYIDQNHHLPEIPSEEEVVKNGLNLGEMNKLLLKKVEELTLYLIDKDSQLNNEKETIGKQQGQIQQQQNTNRILTGQLKSQQKQIDELKTQFLSVMRHQQK